MVNNDQFQTPGYICDYMASLVQGNRNLILEPTPGTGNLVRALETKGRIVAPVDFFTYIKSPLIWYDYVVMNPPFTPMAAGYDILFKCMDISDNIIALMPWLTIINSKKRTQKIMEFGLKSITHLPRDVFKGSRVQCCILEMKRGFTDETVFKNFNQK